MKKLLIVFVLPSLTDAIRLIEVQNKIAGLQELRRLKFVVPEGMAQRLAQEQEDALSSLRGGMKEGLEPVDTALADLERSNEEKNKEARKLLQKAAEKLFKDTHKVDEIMAKWDQAMSKREIRFNRQFLEIAQLLEPQGELGYLYSQVARTYGGPKRNSIVARAELAKMFAELEKQREGLRARLEVLKRLKSWMDAYEFLKDPQDWLVKQVDKYAVEVLASAYSEESRKMFTEIFTTIRESVVGAAEQWKKIDQSVANIPESTRKMCKAFAVAGGMIKSILGALKELKVEGPFEAAFAAIGYYAEAFDVIWNCAEVLAQIFDKQRQNQVTEADWGLESKLAQEKGNNGVLERDADAAAFGVPILTNGREWFLLMNDREYETLTKEQRDRAVQAMADERIQNGFYEASEGWGSWVGQKISNAWEYLWSGGQADLKESERKAHEERLLAVSRKTLIDRKSLAAMARGTDGYFSLLGTRKSVSCEKLAEMREEFLEKLGRDFFIRDAMGAAYTKPEWRKAYTDFWIAFTKADVAFSRKQLGHLFRGYVENPDAEKLTKALLREEERRRIGNLEIAGVYAGPEEAPAGKPATLEADFSIDGLPAGEEVEATVTWKGPSWASGKTEKVKIHNGVVTTKYAVEVPAKEETHEFEATIEVAIPQAAPVVAAAKLALKATKKTEPGTVPVVVKIVWGDKKAEAFDSKSGQEDLWFRLVIVPEAEPLDSQDPEYYAKSRERNQAVAAVRRDLAQKLKEKKFARVVVTVGEEQQFYYAPLWPSSGDLFTATFNTAPGTSLRPGAYEVKVETKFGGKTYTSTRKMKVLANAEAEEKRRKELAQLEDRVTSLKKDLQNAEAKKEEKTVLWAKDGLRSVWMSIASVKRDLWDPAGAKAALAESDRWVTPDREKYHAEYRMSWAWPDPVEHEAWCVKAGAKPYYSSYVQWSIRYKDDLGAAWGYHVKSFGDRPVDEKSYGYPKDASQVAD